MKSSGELHTLRNSLQYRRVYDLGQKFHTPYFSAFILKNDSRQRRFGITVTRKIGSAVVRNRCKRRLREVIRKHQLGNSTGVGFDMILNVKPGLHEADFKELESSYLRVVRKFFNSLTA